jgi:hypothetical protein
MPAMERNFFEAIALADAERVHSQVLAWLFESSLLSATQKSEILAKLAGIAEDCSKLIVETEYEHIDVLVETASSIIAIENKIKSAEHGDQLLHYEKALRKKAKSPKLIYLSLCPEAPTRPNWIYRTYDDLHLALSPHIIISPARFEEFAFNEYVDVVGRFVEVVRAFRADHTQFRNVFTDGGVTKHEKRTRRSGSSPYQDFVRRNQLETPLQRYFLLEIHKKLLPACVEYRVEESHGIALLHIVFVKLPIGGREFQWAVQFQGTTAKLTCSAWDYYKSTPDQLPPEVIKDFESEKSRRQDLRGPNRPRSKAYISLSMKMKFEWTDSFDHIAESHRSAYEDLSVIGQRLAAKFAS